MNAPLRRLLFLSVATAALGLGAASASAAVVIGTDGNDTITPTADGRSDMLSGLAGNDRITVPRDGTYVGGVLTKPTTDRAYGGDGDDVISFSTAAGSTISGGAGNDVVVSGSSDDDMTPADMSAEVNCGGGIDLFATITSFHTHNAGGTTTNCDQALVVDYGHHAATQQVDPLFDAGAVRFGTGAADRLNGSRTGETLVGGNGNDLLFASATTRTASGYVSGDYQLGGAGDDVIDTGVGAANFTGNSADTHTEGGPGNDVIILRDPDAKLDCGDGYDIVYVMTSSWNEAYLGPTSHCEEFVHPTN